VGQHAHEAFAKIGFDAELALGGEQLGVQGC
jgi:hypothetical protein